MTTTIQSRWRMNVGPEYHGSTAWELNLHGGRCQRKVKSNSSVRLEPGLLVGACAQTMRRSGGLGSCGRSGSHKLCTWLLGRGNFYFKCFPISVGGWWQTGMCARFPLRLKVLWVSFANWVMRTYGHLHSFIFLTRKGTPPICQSLWLESVVCEGGKIYFLHTMCSQSRKEGLLT